MTIIYENPVDKWAYQLLNNYMPLNEETRRVWREALVRITLSICDQQLVTSLGMLVIGLIKHCTIDTYHFVLISDLVWLGWGGVSLSMIVVSDRLQEAPVFREWRFIFATALMILFLSYLIWEGHSDLYNSWNCNMQCLMNTLAGNVAGEPAFWMSLQAFLVVLSWLDCFQRLYPKVHDSQAWFLFHLLGTFTEATSRSVNELRSRILSTARDIDSKVRPTGYLRRIWHIAIELSVNVCSLPILVVLDIASLLLVIVKLYVFSYMLTILESLAWFAFGVYSVLQDRWAAEPYLDKDEDGWQFGQIMQLMLLFLPFMFVYESLTGKVQPTPRLKLELTHDLPRIASLSSKDRGRPRREASSGLPSVLVKHEHSSA